MSSAILKLFNPSAASAKKTVDGVLAAFNSAITDLDAVRTQSLAEAHEQEQQAILSTQAARAPGRKLSAPQRCLLSSRA